MENISIRPSRDLRNNYTEISKICREQGTPIAVTVNGRQDTVLVGHEQYMLQQAKLKEMQAQLELYTHLAQARDDIKLGRINDADDVYTNLIAKLESLRDE